VLHHIGAVVSLGVGDAAFLSTSLPDLRPALAPDAGPARPPGQAGVATTNTSGFPLVELALADADDLDAVGRHLFDRGIYVTLAPYPVVPRREVGFRIQVTAANTAEQVDHLLAVLEELDDRFGFRRPHL
jgi:7-keto-8-aminopelargonate synthetase-like enzyme